MNQISVCGADCGKCGCYGELCKGCNACEGVVFHTNGAPCAIFACCKHERGHRNCGACGDMPCGIWFATRDPSMTDEAFAASVRERSERLNAQMGEDA